MAKKLPADCMPRCSTCKFGEFDPRDTMGLCHRLPPTFVCDEEVSGFSFAAVADDDWCGEFLRNTN